MIDAPRCPVCDDFAWTTKSIQTYRSADIAQPGSYAARRYRVLFELWCPGQTEVTLSWQLCQSCGFVLYTPRPSLDDMDRKYRFLGSLPPDESSLLSPGIRERRALDIFQRLIRYVQGNKTHVLDFGGGDGYLMSKFVAQGYDCFLVDYCPEPISGVIKLGDTAQELPDSVQFDLIICSHVLEHVVNPFKVLSDLRARLADKGVLYVEVPMEIWKSMPTPIEPVTHVNYFTVDSLRYLLRRAAFRIISCGLGNYVNPFSDFPTAIRAFVTGADRCDSNHCDRPGSQGTDLLLAPDLLTYLRMIRIHPRRFLRAGYAGLRRWAGLRTRLRHLLRPPMA